MDLHKKTEKVGMGRSINARRQRRVYLHDPFVMQLSQMGKAVKYRHLGESANVVVMQQPLKKSRVTVIHHAFRKCAVCEKNDNDVIRTRAGISH